MAEEYQKKFFFDSIGGMKTNCPTLVALYLRVSTTVRFKSYNEPLLDTGNELVAYIVIGVFSYFTHQGAARIPERMKVGLQRVRSQGKTLGRPDGFKRWKDKSASSTLR